ncbi:MAG TPA: hypothetical protein VH374_06005 [Polyangia bacterium]|jgi:hypothetical protein|nr:hypothetical protein [Polyangia bacterium]
MNARRDSKPRRQATLGALAALALAFFVSARSPALSPFGAAASAAPESAAPVVYVYLHTETKFAELEQVLRRKLPALEIIVFGRFRDFEEAMAARPPDALLGVNALLVSQNVRPTLQGFRANADWETYSLLSVGDTFEGPDLGGKAVGVVDLLGRAATQEFVSKLLGSDEVKVKRVTKREDLLPLLQLALADGIVTPTATVRDITERSRLPLRVRELSAVHVKLASVGVRTTAARALIVSQFRALDATTNWMLGVDAWRIP